MGFARGWNAVMQLSNRAAVDRTVAGSNETRSCLWSSRAGRVEGPVVFISRAGNDDANVEGRRGKSSRGIRCFDAELLGWIAHGPEVI